MISVELAKKLKDAGLKNTRERGSFFWDGMVDPRPHLLIEDNIEAPEGYTWLPSLSQLLAEIERRGYRWYMWKDRNGNYNIGIDQFKLFHDVEFTARTADDSAGQALLWIMEQEAKNGQ